MTATQRDQVRTFMPWVSDEEHPLRCRLMNARSVAAVRAIHSKHERASAAYWLANQIANEWALTPASPDDLTDILHALTRLFMVATACEQLYAPDEEISA